MVATAGLPLEVTLVNGRKSSPSLAMAKRTRGIGNMDPSRLERQTTNQTVSDSGKWRFVMCWRLNANITTRYILTWWTEHTVIQRPRRTWQDPSRHTQRPRAGGFSHWVHSTASLVWEQQTQRSRPGNRWAGKPQCPQVLTSEGSSPPRLQRKKQKWLIFQRYGKYNFDESVSLFTIVQCYHVLLTCRSDAVKSNKSIEACCGSSQGPTDTIREKSPHSIYACYISSRGQVPAAGKQKEKNTTITMWLFTVRQAIPVYWCKTGWCKHRQHYIARWHYLNSAVAFIRASSLICQLEMSPLMNPEMVTKSSTRMLIAVKTLLIVVDSFTPNASRPSWRTWWISLIHCITVG